MFSALKRLTKRQDDTKVPSPFPSGVAAIGEAMQRKFAKGVQYNMKIVIKGDRNTGKTCLFQRLQGKPFTEAYLPSQSIQAASINWNYRGKDSIVKVDVWDIVDKGQKQQKQDSLKISNEPEKANSDHDLTLDADSIDVYKGTHGVIMLLDITKPWTLLYVERELPRVPNHIPVLVLANRKDMCEHQLVDVDRMVAFIEHLDRPVGSAEVNFAESSMKDGFGLQYLYKFLNIPFLILQRETLLRQLEANALEIEEIRETLICEKDTGEQNYEMFKEALQTRRVSSSGVATPSTEADETASEASPSIARKEETVKPSEIPPSNLPPKNVRQSAVSSANPVSPGRNYSAKIEVTPASTMETPGSEPTAGKPRDINEFTPEEDLDPSFLNEEKQKRWWKRQGNKKQVVAAVAVSSNDESDDEGGNPLVADYQDLDSEDEQPAAVLYKSDTVETESHVRSNDPSSDEDSDSDSSPRPLVSDPLDDIIADIQYEPQGPLSSDPLDDIIADIQNETRAIDKTHKPVKDSTVVDKNEVENKEFIDVNNSNISDEKSSDDDDDDKNQQNHRQVYRDDDDDDDDEYDQATSSQYQVTADFDLDDPSIDSWLADDKEAVKQEIFPKHQDNKVPTQRPEEVESKQDDSPKESSDIDGPRHSSFTFAADELDMFVTEQLRKTSLVTAHKEEEVEKPKKKKAKKKGEEGTKKKKNKSATSISEGGKKEPKTKKPKSKDGKKKKKSKRITESEDYELI